MCIRAIANNQAQVLKPDVWLENFPLAAFALYARRMVYAYNGLLGLLVLAGDIWAILNTMQSLVSNEKKPIWIVTVVLLPLLGLILWYLLGPRGGRSS